MDVFGERLIIQISDQYPFYYGNGRRGRSANFMQFTDGTRIDLPPASMSLLKPSKV
ncbi:hypothetical protein GLW04_05425 [Halobacillus litoralis]|uniref:Uncharacterized protein n=1 Tax=Halobacillus litoralis TaxID=45668 RepID=A0A845DSI7_9BACI|nr:hypothetical protein [Halobacillus litoralis]MYL28466.1 hypothetical protein [Halobacillus halophilus]MYL38102.1 hypothetical protein [Halobacillus litoralis]